jgi:hypothetical protein
MAKTPSGAIQQKNITILRTYAPIADNFAAAFAVMCGKSAAV